MATFYSRHSIFETLASAQNLGTRADQAMGEGRALIPLDEFNVGSSEHRTIEALGTMDLRCGNSTSRRAGYKLAKSAASNSVYENVEPLPDRFCCLASGIRM